MFRTKSISRLLGVAALLCAGAISAAPAQLGFQAAVERAIRIAPTLAARQSQALAAREEAGRAAALPDPKLSVAIENLPITGADAFDFRADEMTMKRVGVMQEFPARAKRRAQQAVADRLLDQAQALTVVEQLSVARATAEAWINVWAAERELAALQGLGQQSALAIRVAKARLGAGTGTAVDAMATQASALELENKIEAADAAAEGARSTLARWLDAGSTEVSSSGAPPDLSVLPTSEADLLSSIERQGPVLPWQSREAGAEAEVDLATAQKRPDWSIGAAYGQRSGSRSDMLTLEFSVQLPLFTVNRQDRGIAARRADLDAVVAAHQEARRAQLEAVRRGLAEWKGLNRQVVRKEREMLPLARDRAETALAGYRGGGELQPWLEARRDELELHIEHARHLGELGRAWAALAYLLPTKELRP